MYFDAVLTNEMSPIFNGTAEETRAWLRENPVDHSHQVCIGQTMKCVSVEEYLASHEKHVL